MTALADLDWPRRTERLRLRPARAEDAPEVWEWHRLPAVTEWLARPASDQMAFNERFTSRLDETVVMLLDGRIIGSAKVHVEDGWAQADVAHLARDQQCELGWVLDPSVHGQAFGTEAGRALLEIAFDGLGVRRVVAYCFADNVASWKLMERIGMRQEGLFRAESLHRSGRWLDGMTWAILADEWRALHG